MRQSERRERTRRSLQQAALELIAEKGYDGATVEEIAARAGLSHMTFFRHFPTKEDVILGDSYDPLLAEAIGAQPRDTPALERVGAGIRSVIGPVYAADRRAILERTTLIATTPQLRARLWQQQSETERMIAGALAVSEGLREPRFHHRIVAAASTALLTTTVLVWADGGGRRSLPSLIDEAFTTLRTEALHHHA